jgi:hypothetical protein
LPLRPSELDGDVLAVNIAQIAKLLSEHINVVRLQGRRGNAEIADTGPFSRLLRSRHQRPRDCRAAEQRDELATLHSITSSAQQERFGNC